MAAPLPATPPAFKPIQHYLKTACEHDKRDPVVSYYCRLYALQRGMEIDKKSQDCKIFLMSLMDLLETSKKELADDEAVTSEVVGQAHMENYALKLFLCADNEDRAARFGKNVVKYFYTAGMLFDVLTNFGELSEDIEKNRKYAKWKAAYIHQCLKNGETPIAGPLPDEQDEFGAMGGIDVPQPGASGFEQPPSQFQQPPPQQPQGYQPPGGSYPPPAGGYPPAGGQHLQPGSSQSPHAPPTTPADPPASHPTPSQPAPAPQPPVSPTSPDRWKPEPPSVSLKAEDYQKAMKLCKYAGSALQYEDSKTAIDNLTKALNLLTTGKE